MAQPLDALHFREVFGRMMHGPHGLGQAFTVAPIEPDVDPRQASYVIRSVRNALTDILDHGEIFYVSSEITAYLLETLEKLEHRRVFHFEPGDFPTRIGLVYFDHPVPIPTILNRSGAQNLRAMLWGQLAIPKEDDNTWLVPGSFSEDKVEIAGKVVYTAVDSIRPGQWRDRRFERSADYQLRNSGPWTLRHWIPIPYQQRFDWESTAARVNATDWANELMDPEEKAQDTQDAATSVNIALRLLLVWTTFLQTPLYGGHRTYDSTAHDKVVAREGRPPAQVRILTLRHPISTSEMAHQVEVNWQYRWKVREHYRNQRVGPGRAFVRRVLIREHWKGPENKPQVHQDTIQAVTQ